MKSAKMFLTAILLLLLTCSYAYTTSYAHTAVPEDDFTQDVEPVLDYASAQVNSDGSITYNVLNAKEIAEFLGIENPMYIKYTVIDQPSYDDAVPSAMELINVTYQGTSTGTMACTQIVSYNDLTDSIQKSTTLSASVSNTYSVTMTAGKTVSASTISAALGFNVTATVSIQDTANYTQKPKQTMTVTGYPRYYVYAYDIANNKGIFGYEEAGYGTVKKVYGMYTVVQSNNPQQATGHQACNVAELRGI